jgi:hypothetical protein
MCVIGVSEPSSATDVAAPVKCSPEHRSSRLSRTVGSVRQPLRLPQRLRRTRLAPGPGTCRRLVIAALFLICATPVRAGVQLVGDQDNFHPGDPVDTPYQSAIVLAFIASSGMGSLPLDASGEDHNRGWTFVSEVPSPTDHAILEVHVRNEDWDDVVILGGTPRSVGGFVQGAGAFAPLSHFLSLGGTGTIQINLSAVPNYTYDGSTFYSLGTINLLSELADGSLDCIVTDDSAVDWAELNVVSGDCSPQGACCNPANGACTLVLQQDCVPPAIWYGGSSCCLPNPCVPVLIGGSTLASPPPYRTGCYAPVSASYNRANQFRVVSGGPYSVEALQVAVSAQTGTHASFWIYSDTQGIPGQSLASFDVPQPPSTPAVVSVHPDTDVELQGGTLYWLVGGAVEGIVRWYCGLNAYGRAATRFNGGPWTVSSDTDLNAFAVLGARMTGACCNPVDGCCILAIQEDCPYEWQGANIFCAPSPCLQPFPPATPSNLAATTQGPSSILLAWQDNSCNESTFRIERRVDESGPWSEVSSLHDNMTNWTDEQVSSGVRYYYRVRARNLAGYSSYSNLVTATAGQIPTAPTDLEMVTSTTASITLRWRDHAANEAGFRLQRRPWSSPEWELLSTPGASSGSQGQVTYLDEGLLAFDTYYYRVQAYNACGASDWSNVATGFTEQGQLGFTANVYVWQGVQPAVAAEVFRDHGPGSEFESVGLTPESGIITIDDLQVGDHIRAKKQLSTRRAAKDGHEVVDNLQYRLYQDSDLMEAQGNWRPVTIATQTDGYHLWLDHPIFCFNLVVSMNFDASPAFFNQLEVGFSRASDYMYNATDGQAMFGKIVAFDCGVDWLGADMQIKQNDADGAASVIGGFECPGWECPCPDIQHCLGQQLRPFMFFPSTIHHEYPDQPGYYRTIVHECAHYIFQANDEYLNGHGEGMEGSQLPPWAYRDAHREEYPSTYGVMQDQRVDGAGEFSALNDYLTDFSYHYCASCRFWCADDRAERATSQAYWKCEPVWKTVQWRLQSYGGLTIRTPPTGSLLEGSPGQWGTPNPPKRPGPTGSVGLSEGFWSVNAGNAPARPTFVAVNCDLGGRDGRIVARLPEGSNAKRSEVYLRSGDRLTYLGWVDRDDPLPAPGLMVGDRVVVGTVPRGREKWSGESEFRSGPAELNVIAHNASEPSTGARSGSLPSRARTSEPTGLVISASLLLNPSAAIVLSVRADRTLTDSVYVSYSYGGSHGVLPMQASMDSTLFLGTLVLDLADSLADGSGVFEVAMTDTAGYSSQIFAPWWLDGVRMDAPTICRHRDVLWQVAPPDLQTETAALTLAPVVFPHRSGSTGLTPVGAAYSIDVTNVINFPFGIGFNLSYTDEDVAGLDETSLALYRWDDAAIGWTREDSCTFSPAGNLATLLTHRAGTYGLFAQMASNDVTPPGAVDDLGCATGTGQGKVVLMWTAPGDDGDAGQSLEYILRAGPRPVTEANWDSCAIVQSIPAPAPAGADELATIDLGSPGQLFYLALRARDEAGNLGPISNTTYALSGTFDPNYLPSAPADVRAVDAAPDSGGVVSLTWQRSSDDGGGKNTVNEYRIYRADPSSSIPVLLGTVSAGTTSYLDRTAVTGLSYTYWVSAADAVQQSFGTENKAFSARNLGVPMGDFTSDGVVGINDLALFVNAYGVDSTDLEYDPLFDLDHQGEVFNGDLDSLAHHFAQGGNPASPGPGANSSARVLFGHTHGGLISHLNVRIEGASNLAGYSLKIYYPAGALAFSGATSDSSGIVGNLLNQDGGITPLFMASAWSSGVVWIANAIKGASPASSPEGDGFLAQLTFSGPNIENAIISDVVLLDSSGLMDFPATGVIDEVGEESVLLRPYLFQSRPNPFDQTTTICYNIPRAARVSLKVFDVQGRLVRTLVDGVQGAGLHPVIWNRTSNDGHTVADGVYFYWMQTPGYERSRKLVLLK